MALSRLARDASMTDLLSALERDSAVIIEELAPVALLDQIERELAPWLDRPLEASPLPHSRFTGFRTLRTSGLIAKSAGCGELVMHPAVLGAAEAVLGPQCSRIQLSITQAVKIGPGESAQVLHRDSNMYPFRRPGPEVFLNSIWALSEFSEEIGGTRVIPGSHTWSDERVPGEGDRAEAVEMPRGSVLIYYGSSYHGGGANRTEDKYRTGIIFGYTVGWLRQEENQYLAVPPEKAKTLPVELQRLIGYAEHFPFLGWYEGEDEKLFRGGEMRRAYNTALQGRSSK